MPAIGDNSTLLKPRLVVGLGNPGREYENTRHNIGFMVVDALANLHGAKWTHEKRWDCAVAKIANGWLLKPLTYMNLSGQAVSAVSRFYKISPQEVLAVYDDVDLPLGSLRVRLSGGAAGHNGVRSLISHLGGEAFPRVKVGIGWPGGRPPGELMVSHVLGRFQEDENSLVRSSIDRAVETISSAFTRGMEATMNLFNSKDQTTPKS